MPKASDFNRRTFLKSAGISALAGAVGASGPAATAAAAETSPLRGKYNFDEVYDRHGTDCVKWDYQDAKFGDGMVKVGMGIADMDFRAAPCITDALARRTKHQNWGYTTVSDSYIDAIVNWNRTRHGIDVDPDSIVISSGVHPGLVAALNTICDPGTKVLLMTPTYNGFYGDIRWSRTVASESKMIKKDGRYSVDWDDFESRMTPDTSALMLCNPQNPTGNCWSKDDLMRIGKLCLENQVTVLADEIHCDFIRADQVFTPFSSLPDKDIVANSLTFKAISKTFSLAAFKNGYWFSTNPVLRERVRYNHRVDLNTLGLVVNEAGYREGAPWVDQLLPYIDENHRYAEAYIKERVPGVDYAAAHGTYLAWLDVSGLMDKVDAHGKAKASQMSDSPMNPSQYMETWFVDNAGVQLNPGASYGKGGEHCMRMNLGAPRPLIKQALDSIAEAVDRV